MTAYGSGHIVNVSSLAASAGFVGMSLCCSSKTGLSNSHRVLRHELASCPVRTTLVEVGPIPTDMLSDVYSLAVTERSFRRMDVWG
ncbi:MAG: SDR family NAD(P)-dependent oxidoreductase [Ilumatobacteraceae bacterium]